MYFYWHITITVPPSAVPDLLSVLSFKSTDSVSSSLLIVDLIDSQLVLQSHTEVFKSFLPKPVILQIPAVWSEATSFSNSFISRTSPIQIWSIRRESLLSHYMLRKLTIPQCKGRFYSWVNHAYNLGKNCWTLCRALQI